MDLSRTARAVGRRTVTLGALGVVAAAVTRVAGRSGAATVDADPTALGYPGTSGAGGTGPPATPASRPPSPAPTASSTRGTAAGAGAAGGAGDGTGGAGGSRGGARTATGGPAPAELPRGGRVLFPGFRLVGYSGGPGSVAFGRLGVGDLDQRARELEALGRSYAVTRAALGADVVGRSAPGRDALPVFELITVVAQRFAGDDGLYRERIEPTVIETYLAAARRHQALLLLNIQPGRARFIDEVRALEPWLREPDVAVALDPEWAVRAPVVPGAFFGRVTGAELDGVCAYLAALVKAGNLPEKAMVVHQLAPSVLQGLRGLTPRPGVVAIKSVDGIGTPQAKRDTWRRLVADLPAWMHPGFKLFFAEDAAAGEPLMSPADVLALTPTPDYVLYE